PGRALRRDPGAVPGLRGHPDGHRHDRLGPGERHPGSGPGRRRRPGPVDLRRGVGVTAVPADGGPGAALGARPERPEADHGGLRVRGPRVAQGVRRPYPARSPGLTVRGGLIMALLELRGVFKTFNPGTPDEVRALRGVDLTVEPGSFVVVIGTN